MVSGGIKSHMRLITLAFILGFAVVSAWAQSYSSVAEVITVFSENGQFYLVSKPYDNQTPSLRGITQVFAKGTSEPLYELARGFDSVDDDSNNLVLSNDGETILFLLPWGADDERDRLKSVSIYKLGRLVKSYSSSDITGCDLSKERCSLVYLNYEEVVDREKSNWGTPRYKKTFKAGVTETEKFLSDYPIFASGDLVFVTDSKKNLHRFSLSEARLLDSKPFASIYTEIKQKGRFNTVQLSRFDVPMYPDFPKLRSGIDTDVALGKTLGMRPYDIYSKKDESYRKYSFTLSGFLKGDGSFEVTEIETHTAISTEQIRAFFARNRFAATLIPKPVDRWFISEKIFFFRKANDAVARKERQEELKEYREAFKAHLVAESIEGRYIPKDLKDAFDQMDKQLPEVDRVEMKALMSRNEMIRYHMGLGMWMRNNWGLWGGSRLQKYFTDKGVTHPDDMSSVILFFYWDWLQGNKNAARLWEKDPKQKLF